MKRIFLLFSVCVLLLWGKDSFAQKFEIVFSFPKEDHPRSIVQTPDSGFVMTGGTTSIGDNSANSFLFKIDKLGRWQWLNSYGGNNVDRTDCLQLTSDSGFITAGYSNSFGIGGYDGYLVRTDSLGQTIWSKVIGEMDWDFLHFVEQTTDGGFVAAGGTYNSTHGNQDVWIVRTDQNGDTLWTKTYGSLYDDEARCIRVCTNNDLVIFGTTADSVGNKDAYLLRTDANGDTIWTKTFGDSLADEGRYVEQTSDGGFILAVSYTQLSDSVKTFRLIKTDGNGDQQWAYNYFGSPENAEPYEVHQLANGNYACFGYDENNGGGGKDFRLLLANSSGGFIKGPGYGKLQDDIGYSMKPTLNNGFIMVGETQSYGAFPPNIYVILADSDGISSGSVVNGIDDIAGNTSQLNVFPNPVKNVFYFVIKGLNARGNKTNSTNGYEVYDLSGRLVMNQQVNINTDELIKVDVSNLAEGAYFIRIVAGESIFTSKLIISR